jgi:hypothetical protein
VYELVVWLLELGFDNERSVPFAVHQLFLFLCDFDVVGDHFQIPLNTARHICLENQYHIGIVKKPVQRAPILLSGLVDSLEQSELLHPTM